MRAYVVKITVLGVLLLSTGACVGPKPFHFVVLGDTAYNVPDDYMVYEALIARINEDRPRFTIHVGDILGGASRCDDETMARIHGFFQQYDHPLIYTPGDNEWSDCWREGRGGYDPLERLAFIRRTFFPGRQSLGARPMPVIRQSGLSAYSEFVENARWEHNGVLFATVHVVGLDGIAVRDDPSPSLEEFAQRNKANLAWIDQAFRMAKNQGHKGIVLALHADMFLPKRRDHPAYRPTIEAIKRGTAEFQGQVLIVHGDWHRFVVDRPLREYRAKSKRFLYTNITRLQVFGAPEIKAIRVTVDPQTPWVFGFSPLTVEE